MMKEMNFEYYAEYGSVFVHAMLFHRDAQGEIDQNTVHHHRGSMDTQFSSAIVEPYMQQFSDAVVSLDGPAITAEQVQAVKDLFIATKGPE